MTNASKEFTLIKNAIVAPLRGTMDAFEAGIFNDTGCVASSLLKRLENEAQWTNATPMIPDAVLHQSGSYIFGGYWFAHYGHFILESLSRVFCIKKCNSYPLIFLSPDLKVFRWQRDILKLLRIDNEIIITLDPLLVDKLLISEQQSIAHEFITHDQVNALAQVSPGNIRRGKKVWISRSEVIGGSLVDELEIEHFLENNGWEIYHPQQHRVIDQIKTISASEYVAGLDGSAFFNVLLSKRILGKVFVFSRRNFIPKILPRIFSLKNIEHEFHIPQATYVSGKKAGANFKLNNIEDVLTHLKGL